MIQKTGRKKGIMLSDKIGLRRDWMTNKQLKSDNTDTGSVSASASSLYIRGACTCTKNVTKNFSNYLFHIKFGLGSKK